MVQVLPSGQVTFAFTDVVGSTLAFTEHGQAYADAMPMLHAQIEEVAAAHGGVVVKTEGDGAFLAFPEAAGAVRALREMQARVDREPTDGLWLRIRAGAHTGPAEPIDGDYLALAVHVAARVSSAAGAGQVLVSGSVVEEIDAPNLVELGPVDVGVFELKDVREPMQLWRVAGDSAAPRATPARRTNVAVAHSSFVGREVELDELGRLLDTPGLVTVVGPGGVGKTRLVSEYAVRNASDRADGIWMVELAPVTSADQVIAAVALTLGLSGLPTSESVAAELARRGKPLLILDNCEHLADAVADATAELLRMHPVLSVVATSREALDVQGERIQRLSPLGVSEPTHGKGGGALAAAEELFLSRAQTAGGTVSQDDLPVVAQICRLLDGLPLAVELAAPRAASMPPRELLPELERGGLQLRRRGGAQRQRNLNSLVGWSLDLLDAAHRSALLVLSVFPGRFTGEMARQVMEAVGGLPQGAAGELARRSLLDLDGDDYRMLVTIRDVVKSELAGLPETYDAAMKGLFAWAVDRANKAHREREEITEPQVRALEAGLAWALADRSVGCGRLMVAVTAWVHAHTPSQHAQAMAETVLTGPGPTSSDEVLLHAAAIRLTSGLGYASSVSAEQARDLLTAARRYETEDPDCSFYAAGVATSVLARYGHLEEALPVQLDLVAVVDNDWDREAALTEVGVTYHLLGDLAQAERYYREALGDTNDKWANQLVLMSNLGEVMLDAGRLDEAAAQLRATVQRAHGRATISAWALGLLVVTEAERGAIDVARALAGDAETALEEVMRTDTSVSYVLDRMREAMARLPVSPSSIYGQSFTK